MWFCVHLSYSSFSVEACNHFVIVTLFLFVFSFLHLQPLLLAPRCICFHIAKPLDLRNLLSHQKSSGPNRGSPNNAPSSAGNANVNNQFNTANFMGSVPPGSAGPQHRMAAQMGGAPPGYLSAGGHQNFNQGQAGPNSNGMGMAGNNPRFQNFQRFTMPPAAMRHMMGNVSILPQKTFHSISPYEREN